MKKITVFGGSGFLGSHVVDKLINEGFEVTICDQKKSNYLQKNQNFKKCDILNLDEVKDAVKGSDIVYNFAALADLNDAINKPLETININILGNANILEACKEFSIKRFVYASTVYVYGKEGGFYRCSKKAAEDYVKEYSNSYNLDYTILQYGSLYGPRSDISNGLFRIVDSALKTGYLKYDGNPNATRSYIHVEDAAQSSVDILDKDFINESVILSGLEPIKIIDMLKTLAEIMGMPEEKIVFSDKPQTGHYIKTPYSYSSNIGKKYIPSKHIDLGQGLLQLIHMINK
ncbi:NAD(P)-dependent oxidoreductase [Gammaproteobacteria bacterium]|nr:NAD(P)-dependent oxidoreductase [Gammaproteobacteria bacterium]MDA9045636.1 NAD(P)-dependent oxidoreductase [Gammaproteobacteria bacterium]